MNIIQTTPLFGANTPTKAFKLFEICIVTEIWLLGRGSLCLGSENLKRTFPDKWAKKSCSLRTVRHVFSSASFTWNISCRSNLGVAEDRSGHSRGRSEHTFPCWSGSRYTRVSSKSFEVCLCHWGGIVHASYSIALWPSQWLTLKDGLNPSSPLLHLLL